jgi:inorganic triphosphatase YgiF
MSKQVANGNRAQPGREIELKLAVQRRDLPRLRRRLRQLGSGTTFEIENTYFDTADRWLRRHRLGLRLRRIGRRWLQTLKTEGQTNVLTARGEWQMPLSRGALDLSRLRDTPLKTLLRKHPRKRLLPVFRTAFSRTCWNVRGGAIEVALDEGEIVAGRRRAPIVEIELELKSGPADALFELALELVGQGHAALPLLACAESKAERGYRLAAGETPLPVKANAQAVVGSPTRRTTLPALLRGVIERGTVLLLVNTTALAHSADPEFVHQARVAVRRMRSVARLIGDDAAWPKGLDTELRWIARRLGAVRDWDVLQSATLPAWIDALPAVAPLARGLPSLRRRDDQALQAALASARFARLVLRLLRWAQRGDEDGETLGHVARKRLARLHRRLFAEARAFAELPIEDQHRMRIRAKRLRYALDLFAAALPAKATARYVERLAGLQDDLGALNDLAVAAPLARRLARAARTDAAPVLAWLAQQRQEHAQRAEAALALLARRTPPWK